MISEGLVFQCQKDLLLDPDWLDPCARAYADPSAWAEHLVSPLRAAHSGLPPLLIHAGEDEVLRDDAVVAARGVYPDHV